MSRRPAAATAGGWGGEIADPSPIFPRVRAVTGWDEGNGPGGDPRGWTVMGRLRERRRAIRAEVAAAKRKQLEELGSMRMMTSLRAPSGYEDSLRARTAEGPTVLAFLFAQPDSGPIRALDRSGGYFDIRTGSTWDLFFPGYYRSGDRAGEQRAGDVPVGSGFAGNWFFSPRDFDLLRRHVQEASGERWRYSGLADLVLVCAWITAEEGPTVDWDSTFSRSLADAQGRESLTLNEAIERISRDLEAGEEDARFGLGETPGGQPAGGDGEVREVVVSALLGIAKALGERSVGS